jgi:cyanophycin synthetase
MNKSSQKTCSACGTSPINHKLLFVSNFLGETLGVLMDKTLAPSNKTNRLANFVEKSLFTMMPFIGILRFNDDIEKAVTGRSKLIWEEARERGIPMRQAVIFGKPIELYKAKIKGKNFFFTSIPVPPHLPQNGYSWIDNKLRLAEELRKAGVKAPKSVKISPFNKNVKKILEKLETPIIVKPKDGSRGRHTTTNIKTEKELEKAIKLGKEITLWMVAQEHLFGSVYRATVINGELVGFFKASPPQVKGDGKSTIEELIREQNKSRHEKLSDIVINEDLLEFIERQGYKLDSIPPEGKLLDLSAKTGRMYGGYTKEMLPLVHPKMYSIFKKAAEVVEAPVAGFDLIILDPTKDPDTQRWGIIECNSLPFIDLHYFALEGEPVNLAKKVWDLWE